MHDVPIVLVVDDDVHDLRSLREELIRRFGSDYEVNAEPSPAGALRALRELRAKGREVALVIADMWMAGMTGVELLMHARHVYPEGKRAVIWSYGDMRALEPLYGAMALGGVDDYLTRPWIPAEQGLYRPVEELLG